MIFCEILTVTLKVYDTGGQMEKTEMNSSDF